MKNKNLDEMITESLAIEAEEAKDQVLKMKKADRDALVKFVESL